MEMVDAKTKDHANTLKEVKHLCKKFGLTADILKGSLAEGRQKK